MSKAIGLSPQTGITRFGKGLITGAEYGRVVEVRFEGVVDNAPTPPPTSSPGGLLALTIVLMLMSNKFGTFSFMAGGATIGLLTRGRAWDLILGLIW